MIHVAKVMRGHGSENWVNFLFFSPDSAEPFRFKLQCLEAEIWPSELLSQILLSGPYMESVYSSEDTPGILTWP